MSLTVLACIFLSDANAETYEYTGNPFSGTFGAYETAEKPWVTGSITTTVAIPPNAIDFDIRPFLASWTFFDGVQEITNLNGVYHPFFSPRFYTDAAGNVTRGDVWVAISPLGTELNAKNDAITTTFSGGADTGFIQGTCNELSEQEPIGWCIGYVFGTDKGFLYGSSGTWKTVVPTRKFTGALPSGATGSLTLTTDDPGCTLNPDPQFLAAESASTPPQPSVIPIDGVVQFKIDSCSTGATVAADATATAGATAAATTVTISIDYGSALPVDATYWKVGDPWIELPATVQGNIIEFDIIDGGLGDDDGVVNGIIVNQGGASIRDMETVFLDGFEE